MGCIKNSLQIEYRQIFAFADFDPRTATADKTMYNVHRREISAKVMSGLLAGDINGCYSGDLDGTAELAVKAADALLAKLNI